MTNLLETFGLRAEENIPALKRFKYSSASDVTNLDNDQCVNIMEKMNNYEIGGKKVRVVGVKSAPKM